MPSFIQNSSDTVPGQRYDTDHRSLDDSQSVWILSSKGLESRIQGIVSRRVDGDSVWIAFAKSGVGRPWNGRFQ